MNPIRAGMVQHPGEYPWSSYRSNAMGIDIKLLSPHATYRALGKTAAKRIINYRKLFEHNICDKAVDFIRITTNKQWVIGSEQFVSQIAKANSRKASDCGWGGDRKSKNFRLARLK